VQCRPAAGRQSFLCCLTCDVVPELYPIAGRQDHARVEALVQSLSRRGCEGLEQPQLGRAGFPVGPVTVTESGTTLCTITLASGTGACSMPAAKLPAGKYNLTARYGGGSTVAGSASAVSKLAVAKDTSATSLKLSASAVTLRHENAEHLTIQVKSSRSGAVTGKVTITAKTTGREPAQVCVITLKSGAGSCTLPAKALRPGTYLLTAAYAGSRNILTSDSPKKTLTIRK
jgi:hypothetical protein